MPRNKHPEETVKKILDAALVLFLEKGYEKTSVLDIVERMDGLSRGAFYHHFKSKEAVLDALGDRMFHEHNPFIEIKKRHDLDGIQKIRYIILDSLQNSTLQMINEASITFLHDPKFLAEFFESNKRIIYPAIEELVKEGIEDGSIQAGNTHMMAQLIILLLTIWCIPDLFPMEEKEVIDKIEMCKTMLDAIGLPVLNDEILEVCKNMTIYK